MKRKIVTLLRKFGLYDAAKVVYDFIKKTTCRLSNGRKSKNFLSDFSRFQSRVKKLRINSNCIVFVGILCTNHKPTLMDFISKLSDTTDHEIILFDEVTDSSTAVPFKRFMIPHSYPYHFDKYMEMPYSEENEKLLNDKEFLKNAYLNIKSRCKITSSYAKALVCETYNMYKKSFEILNPDTVVIWNQYSPLHTVCIGACEERGIKTAYLEFGVIPGTFALEYVGQMGRSIPAVNYEEFYSKPVNSEEIAAANNVLNYLLKSRLNRNVQPQNEEESFKKRLKKNRPTILFAGQQDYDSGMVPYTDETKKFNSPCFKTTLEAAFYIAELAKKNDWNFIFKPHPNMAGQYMGKVMPENMIYVNRYDLNELIDMSDVVLTILSQVAYVSLIRKRPVVMLGYNQLRGKKCTYEAFLKENIEETIVSAIGNGFTEEQKDNFTRHTAQLLKYYLFDNLSERPLRYGRCVSDSFDTKLN